MPEPTKQRVRSVLERDADARRGQSSTLHDLFKRGRPSDVRWARDRIVRAINAADGNMKVAAATLRVGRTTLYRLVELYQLKTPRATALEF